MISPDDVTACLVTRGDVDLQPILDNLIFPLVVVWDNSRERLNLKAAGRLAAIRRATTSVIYSQDDDVLVPQETQEELVRSYTPGTLVANWAHGDNPDGLDDVAFTGAGAICDRALLLEAADRYLRHHPADDDFLTESDFIVGTLAPHRHVRLPFTIRDVAFNGRRLADEPGQRERKHLATGRARAIRDAA